jgi:DNA gyrase subunit A
LLRNVDEGTTDFRPTYDGVGEEPDVLPAVVPNLLLNGSSGIAVGMSCSFPPHNLQEVISACRAAIKKPEMSVAELMQFLRGPDFPTGGQILESHEKLLEIYESGHGAVRLRGTYKVEHVGKSRIHLIITSVPYSVNKSKLVERIALLIREKRLKNVYDVRDESAEDVRVVVEIRGSEIKPEAIAAFLYRHTELQINFPMNFIAINPSGAPDRMSLDKIIRHFLEFRYHKTVRRLNYLLEILKKRIHILNGFEILFDDLDKAISLIRSSRSRAEAASSLRENFPLDDQQIDAILDMRLYRLVGIEIGKVLDELASKRKQALEIERDLSSPTRLWKIIDREMEEVASKNSDARLSEIIPESEAGALDYDAQSFIDQDDTSVILSSQGWIRRIKSEVENASNLKFREGDSLLGLVRTNTSKTVTVFTNRGKLYSIRAADIPASGGFGEPLSSMLRLDDGEIAICLMDADPGSDESTEPTPDPEDLNTAEDTDTLIDQPSLFVDGRTEDLHGESTPENRFMAVLVTRKGKGFRFDTEALKEPTKRQGRKIVNLDKDDEVLAVRSGESEFILVADARGYVLRFRLDQVPIMAGPARGVTFMKLPENVEIVDMALAKKEDQIRLYNSDEKFDLTEVGKIQLSGRGARGKKICPGIVKFEHVS